MTWLKLGGINQILGVYISGADELTSDFYPFLLYCSSFSKFSTMNVYFTIRKKYGFFQSFGV